MKKLVFISPISACLNVKKHRLHLFLRKSLHFKSNYDYNPIEIKNEITDWITVYIWNQI